MYIKEKLLATLGFLPFLAVLLHAGWSDLQNTYASTPCLEWGERLVARPRTFMDGNVKVTLMQPVRVPHCLEK